MDLNRFLNTYKHRRANPESMDAHDALKEVIIQAVIQAGMDEQKARDIPWMQDEMFSGSEDAISATEYFSQMLYDIEHEPR